MDLRLLGFDSPLFHTLQHVIDGVDDSDKSVNAPTRTYVRDAKAMAATPADVKDLPNAYQFIIDMPGLKSGDIKVQVEDDNVLVVTGERKREEEKEGVKYVRMERRVGKFMRKFVLPENAKIDAISAVCQDGVLTVTVEKLPPPQPKKPKTIEDNVNPAPQEVSNSSDPTPSNPVPSFGVPPPAMAEALQNALQTFSQQQQQRHEKARRFFETRSGDEPYFFNGISSPDVAEEWIENMETVFEAMSVPNENWVRIVADLLTRWAKEWYETVKVEYGVLDWTTFKQLFNKKYVTALYRVQKQKEFYNLNQERMTVYEYDKKFVGLLRYVPTVLRDEECKIICFQMGLNHDIKLHLAARIFESYQDVYECALQVEGVLKGTKRKRNAP